jgi:hypothetical protein
MKTTKSVYGYDGSGYSVGDRVELHPGVDLWAQGARYGVVTSLAFAPGRVSVRLDKLPSKVLSIPADRLRAI